jgi:hypothetical protein
MKAIAKILVTISILFPLLTFPILLIVHGSLSTGQITGIISIFITLMTFGLAFYNGSLAGETGRSRVLWLICSIILIPPLAVIIFVFYLRNQRAAFQIEHLEMPSGSGS